MLYGARRGLLYDIFTLDVDITTGITNVLSYRSFGFDKNESELLTSADGTRIVYRRKRLRSSELSIPAPAFPASW
jgi:hypothetical protein